jgi:hypothetical protein
LIPFLAVVLHDAVLLQIANHADALELLAKRYLKGK